MTKNQIVIPLLLSALTLLFIIVVAVIIVAATKQPEPLQPPPPNQTTIPLVMTPAPLTPSQKPTLPLATFHPEDVTVVKGGAITIPDSIKECTSFKDCAVISDHCGGCTCGNTINKKFINAYADRTKFLCSDLATTNACDMYCENSAITCIKGLCKLIFADEVNK